MEPMLSKNCSDSCEGKKIIFVYRRRLNGWRKVRVDCSRCGSLGSFDWDGKGETRPARVSLMSVVCGIAVACLAIVQLVKFVSMFSRMDLASFVVWCFMWGGVAVLVYGVTRE